MKYFEHLDAAGGFYYEVRIGRRFPFYLSDIFSLG